MAKIINFDKQLQIIGSKGGFDDSIQFYDKQNNDDDFILGVKLDKGDVVIFESLNDRELTEIERFDYSEIISPVSTDSEDLINQLNIFIRSSSIQDIAYSVFTRTGDVVAEVSDYDASQVDNDSGVSGATVKDALDTLNSPSGLAYFTEKATNTNGGTVNAAFGTPLECVPSSGTLEVTVAETGSYIIHGMINIGVDLNKDDGAIELIYGIDTGAGAVIGSVPYSQSGQHKKNKANGVQGTWGNISLNAGDKVHLFLSTLGDSTTWTSGEIFIATWK